jgi:hypothetical protein
MAKQEKTKSASPKKKTNNTIQQIKPKKLTTRMLRLYMA